MHAELQTVLGYSQVFKLTFIIGFPVTIYEKQNIRRENEQTRLMTSRGFVLK
jgi:hypothetical protein